MNMSYLDFHSIHLSRVVSKKLATFKVHEIKSLLFILDYFLIKLHYYIYGRDRYIATAPTIVITYSTRLQ